MNCNEMAGDRLTVCKLELLEDFARLVSISSNFLLNMAQSNPESLLWRLGIAIISDNFFSR